MKEIHMCKKGGLNETERQPIYKWVIATNIPLIYVVATQLEKFLIEWFQISAGRDQTISKSFACGQRVGWIRKRLF